VAEPQIAVPTKTQEHQIDTRENRLALVSATLTRNEKALAALLGNFMPVDRFRAMLVTQCKVNPDLQKCDIASIMIAAMRVAQLRLSPDPALGQAWLIPRKGRAEFQLGWKGCLALAYRSPLVAAVRYGVVRKGEAFTWLDGRDWRLEHVPGEEGWPAAAADTLAAWAILELATGRSIPRVMFTPEILRHKGRGQGSQPAWNTDFAAMCVKTVVGDVCRRAPLGDDETRGFQLDHLGEVGLGQPKEEAIDAEYTVAGEPANGGGKVASFKTAFGTQPTTSAQAPAPEEADREPGEDDDSDPLGDSLNDPAETGTGLLSEEAKTRIRDAAQLKGLTPAQLDSMAGAKLDDAPADLEALLLHLIETYQPAPGKRGK